MKTPPYPILQFGLSPLATTGVLIRAMRGDGADGAEHPVTTPHRDAHYLLLLATEGQCTLNLDFETMAVAAPALLVVFPGQVHHILAMRDLQGWAVSFEPSLLDGEVQLVLENGCQGPRPLNRQTAFYARAVAVLQLLENVLAGPPDAYTGRTAQALLTALLSATAGQLLAAAPAPKAKESRGALLEKAFGQLLKQHYKTWKQPARYAAELAVSVAHLTDTVKALTGAPVSVHIQRRAVLEAKRLLYFTDLSVKEIAYEVGYEEPVYFGKLFKKVAGCPPLRFRQKFRD